MHERSFLDQRDWLIDTFAEIIQFLILMSYDCERRCDCRFATTEIHQHRRFYRKTADKVETDFCVLSTPVVKAHVFFYFFIYTEIVQVYETTSKSSNLRWRSFPRLSYAGKIPLHRLRWTFIFMPLFPRHVSVAWARRSDRESQLIRRAFRPGTGETSTLDTGTFDYIIEGILIIIITNDGGSARKVTSDNAARCNAPGRSDEWILWDQIKFYQKQNL